MRTIPIVFAFDNNFVDKACVCFYSLLVNASEETFYDIFIIHSNKEKLHTEGIDKLKQLFPNCKFNYRQIDDTFENSFEIRGITVSTYYRLVIPDLILEYDKILYSDVDVIFREDLSHYYNIDLKDHYLGGVYALADKIEDQKNYYIKLGVNPKSVIYAGNLIINSRKIREDRLTEIFKQLALNNNYRFQDLDVLNIGCKGGIKYIAPSYCVTTYFCDYAVNNRKQISNVWENDQIEYALSKGIVHYNGQKPWKGYCPNFDIWWEYYRRSPFFDEKYYFNFFYNKLDEFDQLTLLKRVKILLRYFVYGRKKVQI